MKKALLILAAIGIAIGSWVIFQKGPAPVASAQQVEQAIPVIQLQDGSQLIQVFLDQDNEQRFTVTNASGRVQAELLTLEELRASLPGTAEKVGNGLADISATNTENMPVFSPQPNLLPSGGLIQTNY